MTLRRALGVSRAERFTSPLVMAICVVGMLAWAWGVILYIAAGNFAGAVGAFVVIPIGALHAFGVW